MSGVVLVLGALLAVAGVYEMVVGNGDILSERGWSAFIAGAVFVAGGVSTLGLGLAVRAVDRLSAALSASGRSSSLGAVALGPTPERLDPDPLAPTSFAPAIEPAPVLPASGPSASISAPIREDSMLAAPAAVMPTPTALTVEPVGRWSSEDRNTLAHEAAAEHGTPPAATRDHDWLDQNFADLEREMAVEEVPPPTQPMIAPHQSADPLTAHAEPLRAEPTHAEPWDAEPLHAEPVHTEPLHAAPLRAELPEPVHTDRHDMHEATTLLEERPIAEAATDVADAPHDPPAPHPAAADGQATVAAREVPAPTTSPVIGRYESEGTSYVMYADGSIDAQSEAGVYRFASMAELKAFIEG